MPIKVHINRDLNFLLINFCGEISKKDILYFIKRLNASEIANDITKTIVFLKDSKLNFNFDNIEEFAKQTVANKDFKKRNKIAILINNPNDTVAATLYAETITSYGKNILIELFYTLDAALHFLNIEDYKNKLESLLLSQRISRQEDKSF